MTKVRGTLQVVATPIGNLADLSPRAQEALRGADVIAAEDTRRTLQLLQSIGISRPLVSLYEHNEAQRVPQLLERLSAGDTVALVSDAGTPLLSDPGFELVREATRAGFEVRAIPGPSAITTALAAAGLPARALLLRGLPAGARRASGAPPSPRSRTSRARWCSLKPRTASLATLTDMAAEFGAAPTGGRGARAHQGAREPLSRHARRAADASRRRDENFARGEITARRAGRPAPRTRALIAATLRRTVDCF